MKKERTFNKNLKESLNPAKVKKSKEGLLAKSRIVLSEQESRHFMKVMENPPLPNKALRSAARRHGFA